MAGEFLYGGLEKLSYEVVKVKPVLYLGLQNVGDGAGVGYLPKIAPNERSLGESFSQQTVKSRPEYPSKIRFKVSLLGFKLTQFWSSTSSKYPISSVMGC